MAGVSLGLFLLFLQLEFLALALLLLESTIEVLPEVLDGLEVSLLHALQYLFVAFQFDQHHMPKVLIKHSNRLINFPVFKFRQYPRALDSKPVVVVLIVLEFVLTGRKGDRFHGSGDNS
jgi:hypothetical protein